MRVGIVVAGMGAPALAAACCGVGFGGAPVRFTGQTNLIVWDKNLGIEHFVRDARFSTPGKDLGFIAPTPGRPTLAATAPSVFASLESLNPNPPASTTAGAMEMATKSEPVRVIEAKDVAGYHATVLRATDPEALSAWLKANGYTVPAYLSAWSAPYVREGWYLTAFKVNGAATGPIRMSFATKEPFNPYSVPKENGGRVPLKLYYVSAGGEVPRIGGKDAWRSPSWSAGLTSDASANLAEALYLTPDKIPDGAKLTVYDDPEFGRPGLDDLYFVSDDRPVKAGVGLGVGATAVVLLALGVRRRRTPRAA